MRMDLTPTLKPFTLADRPGATSGASPTALTPFDLSGVNATAPKHPDRLAAGEAGKTGLAAIDGAASVDASSSASRHARLEHQARQLVGQTFFGTMLKQMRDSPFKSELFDGGRGGQAFNSLRDQRMVEQMSRGAGKKLVDSIVRKLEARQGYAKQAAAGRAPAAGRGAAEASGAASLNAAVMPSAAARRPGPTSNRNARPDVAAAPARRA